MIFSKLGKELGQPTQSLAGWLVTKTMLRQNRIMEENAVKLCDIKPNETVLELGHGPGFGLQDAVQHLTGAKGKLFGVDYSKYMHNMASEKMKEHIASGKVTLYHKDLTAMPIEDSSVDKVYHCNCYYYWPDLKAGVSEIHRVMKPGGLMVTTLRLNLVVYFASKNTFLSENWRPEFYMEALQTSGFTNIKMVDKKDKNITFQAIYATAAK